MSSTSASSARLALLATLLVLPSSAAAQSERTRCDVAFQLGSLPEATLLGFLDLRVEYERPKIFPLDPTNQLRCTALEPGAAVDASNQFLSSQAGALTIALSSATGFAASAPLLRCEVYSAGVSVPDADDFPVITTLQARSTTGAVLDPLPVISVGTVRCGDAVTTTTTTSTTTTNPPPTTTTTTLPEQSCHFRLRLQSAGGFRQLRVTLDYSDAGGVPAGPALEACRSLAGAGIGILSEPGSLDFEIVSVPALQGPRDLVECAFLPQAFVAEPKDFDVDVLAAAGADGAPALPLPQVVVTGVDCPAPTTTTLPPTTTTLPPSTTMPPICGDADGDFSIEASDALAALRLAVGLPSVCLVNRCDVDASGAVTASDALRILKAAVGSDVTLICAD